MPFYRYTLRPYYEDTTAVGTTRETWRHSNACIEARARRFRLSIWFKLSIVDEVETQTTSRDLATSELKSALCRSLDWREKELMFTFKFQVIQQKNTLPSGGKNFTQI